MGLLSDLTYALRTLRRSPGFTIAALLTLALGIGATTTVFSVVRGVLLRPLPLRDADRLVVLESANAARGMEGASASLPDLREWAAHNTAFSSVAFMYDRDLAVTGGDVPERVEAWVVGPGMFDVLGVGAARGRTFRADEGTAGHDRVVVLGDALWRARFGGRADVVGSAIHLNGQPYTVVGIMPPRFAFPEHGQLWVPLVDDPGALREDRTMRGIARLAPGATLGQARAQLAAVSARQEADYPATNRGWRAEGTVYREAVVGLDAARLMGLMLGAVGLVLVIACANVAGLLLARGAGREREMAVRVAIGAGRGRIVRQLLAESLVLAAGGAALGILVASWWLGAFALVPEDTPFWLDFTIDLPVLAATAAIALLVAGGVGLVPALRGSRPDLTSSLKQGARGGSVRHRRIRSALVLAQVALSVVLLVGAALFVDSFLAITRADAGFNPAPLLTARVYLGTTALESLSARPAYLRDLTAHIGALPGVRAVAATGAIPTDDGGPMTSVQPEGSAAAPPGEALMAIYVPSTAGLFDALGTPLVVGRALTAAEAEDSAATVIVMGQRLARRLWPGGDAVGRRVRLGWGGDSTAFTVVGVARDFQYEEFGEATPQSQLQIHIPYARARWRVMGLVMRTAGDPAALAAPLRAAVRSVDAGVPLYDVRTMNVVRRETTYPTRMMGRVFATFGIVALGLAAVGLYGLIAHGVAQRRHEIGIRMALGARARTVVLMVVRQGLGLTVAGLGAGLLVAVLTARLLRGLLFGIGTTALSAYLPAVIVLLGVGLIATLVPAQRAARVDPILALRAE